MVCSMLRFKSRLRQLIFSLCEKITVFRCSCSAFPYLFDQCLHVHVHSQPRELVVALDSFIVALDVPE